ncbi:MAG: hypothetical protein U9N58_00780 [Thermodesulfobacteriota bacterium]|nr:hypothetical protein [Thermodesulfobacteriota bacterium]
MASLFYRHNVGANLVFAFNPGDHKDRPYGTLLDTPDKPEPNRFEDKKN